MLRRLHPDQPDSFAFTEANQKWAEAQITKYPEGRQASAIIALLWRAHEQEGWLTRPAIEHVSDMLGLAHIRGLEVATFYYMFKLAPVGSVANIQICGTTSCMICGAEDLVAVCRDRIAPKPLMLSEDGKFSWEEVECLGACANAPMAQIGKDYYEDLTAERLGWIIDELAAGRVPTPGPQNGRYASEPAEELTSLTEYEQGRPAHNASVALALDLGDTVKRIDGTEVPLITPWRGNAASDAEVRASAEAARSPRPSEDKPADRTGIDKREAREETRSKPEADVSGNAPNAPLEEGAAAPGQGTRPAALDAPRGGKADDLKMIKGVGPKLEKVLHDLGFYHFDQIAGWTSAEIAWVDENLEGFRGRVTRDEWVRQARLLADGGETEFSKRAKY